MLFDFTTYIDVVLGVSERLHQLGDSITWALELPERVQGYLSMWRQRACRCL